MASRNRIAKIHRARNGKGGEMERSGAALAKAKEAVENMHEAGSKQEEALLVLPKKKPFRQVTGYDVPPGIDPDRVSLFGSGED